MTSPEPGDIKSIQTTTKPPVTDLLSYTFPDSTDVVTQRYNKCCKLVKTIEELAAGYSLVASSAMRQYETLHKDLVGDFPIFETNAAEEGTVSGLKIVAPQSPTSDAHSDFETDEPAPASLNAFLSSMRGHISDSYKKFYELHLKIEEQVLPDLKRLYDETSKRQRTYVSDSGSQNKMLNKLRDASAKQSAELDRAVQQFNRGVHSTSKDDYKKDPYFIKRNLLSDATQQIQAENSRIEFLNNCELQHKAFETKVLAELKRLFDLLAQNIAVSYSGAADQMTGLNTMFNKIEEDKEWASFVGKNASYMISYGDINDQMSALSLGSPEHSNMYKRSIDKVVFSNSDHLSAKPLLEGVLSIKEGLLGISKNYVNYNSVITPSGYFFCFSSRKLEESSPAFVFYLPECEVNAMGSSGKHGEFKFSLRGKDVSTLSIKPKKKQVFRAASEQDYQTWVDTISKTVGAVRAGGGVLSDASIED